MTLLPHIDYSSFKSLLNIQQNATLLISESEEITLANPAAHALLGYENTELHGLSVKLLIPDFASKLLSQKSTHITANPEQHLLSKNYHTSVLTKGGKKITLAFNLATLASQEFPVLITIFYDRRSRAEASLRKSKERLNLAKRAAGLGLYDRDLVSNILYWDERSRELLGFSADEEITYEKFEECIHPEDRDIRRTVLLHTLDPTGDGQYQTEFRIKRKNDGAERWISSTGQVSYESDKPVRLLGLMRDVTELKAAENQSRWRRDETEALLKQQIATHTASAIAHEINQPLAAISAYSEVALHSLKNKNINSDSLHRALEGCVREAQRAGDTLHELMNYLNKTELVVEPVNINQLVKASIEIAKRDGYSGFKPLLYLEKYLPSVACCPLQVEKVILNLLRNAIEATQGSGHARADITIRVQKNEQGNMALITVQDNGPGFDKEVSKYIFQPFFTTKQKGIGMGLLISRSLIEANGGRLWHEQNSETGAIIHFTLPFAS